MVTMIIPEREYKREEEDCERYLCRVQSGETLGPASAVEARLSLRYLLLQESNGLSLSPTSQRVYLWKHILLSFLFAVLQPFLCIPSSA